MTQNFTQKNILITGASGGLGSEIARTFYQQGANIALSGTRQQKLEEIAHQLSTQNPNGGKLEILPCDLSDSEAVSTLVAQSATALGGGIQILISNAGLTRDGLLIRSKTEDWDLVNMVNMKAYYMLAQSCLRAMMKERYGRIIGISSVIGVTGNPGQANYATAKAGMIGFTKSLAQEIASRGITANCIAPGFIVSPMTEALSEGQKNAILAKIPAARFGNASDIAHAVTYLASDEAAYITGQTLHVNGGMAMI